MAKPALLLALTALALTPAVAAACEDTVASWAANTVPAQLSSQPTPAASKMPGTVVARNVTARTDKRAAAKAKANPNDQKLASAPAR
jgi:hypothetical protein